MTTFADFNLDPSILKALERINFVEPSPIQQKTLPLIQDGHDLIALAETGSGKTAACAIPICDRVDINRKDVQALIVVPTRELALQYSDETRRIGKVKGVSSFAIYGGSDLSLQLDKLKAGIQVLIATPGRLIDLIYQRLIDLSQVETLILDEADEMLSMGFVDDLEFIIHCLVHDHQTLLFSATMPKEITQIASKYMKEPREVKLIQKQASPKTIDHKFIYCHPKDKERKLLELMKSADPGQAIIFCQSKIQAEKLCRTLKRDVNSIDFLHGGLNQDLRTVITDKFRRNKIRFMVATDVASRGLDFSNVSHVYIFQMSRDLDIYLHRSGRCGRSGRKGEVVTFISKPEISLAEKVMRRIKRPLNWIGSPPPKNSRKPR